MILQTFNQSDSNNGYKVNQMARIIKVLLYLYFEGDEYNMSGLDEQRETCGEKTSLYVT
jgi:hypothetical protein